MLGETDPNTLVDRAVFKNGKLAYIEIFHKRCWESDREPDKVFP